MPRARIAAMSSSGVSVASMWNVKEEAPAAANASTHCAGLELAVVGRGG
jgi:hypothetical protein